jgi:hypothetical protein
MLSVTITRPWNDTTLGRGNCGSRSYPNVGDNTIQAITAALQQGGAIITGNNPWDVDTRQHGVKLRGTWDPSSQILVVEIIDSAFLAPCSRVVSAVDTQLRQVIAANPSPQSGLPSITLAADLESLANEVAEKSNPSGVSEVNVTNIFRLTPSAADRNAIALRAIAIVSGVSAGKVASIQASLAEANELSPITTDEPILPSTPEAVVEPTASGMSLGAKVGIGAAIAGALVLTALVIRRAVGTMRP